MNIHEYQGKALLKGFGAPVAEGVADLQRRARRKPPPSSCPARSMW